MFVSNLLPRRRIIMSRLILAGVWLCVGSVALFLVFTNVTQAVTYRCDNITERKSVDFEGIRIDRVCMEYVATSASEVDKLRQSCLNPSTGTGQWAKGECDKGWVAACSIESIGPRALNTPFTYYTYQPTGGNTARKQVVEIARQKCKIMSFGSGKFKEK